MTATRPVPSRRVLDEATARNRELGHENLGFLSEERGFLPQLDPLLALPPSHRAWDAIVPQMPALHRTLRLRAVLDALPVLSAAEDALPDRYVCRAAAVLSFFAHAYVRVQTAPPAALPAAIAEPWAEICRRLGRPAPSLSYIDLIVYNWRRRDPRRVDLPRTEDLELLIPTVGNQEERVFHLAQLELVAQGAPLVGLTVRAQGAIARDDRAALKGALIAILTVLQELTEVSYLKVDPNRHSPTFIDQAVWAKTVAPFALPIDPVNQGSAGSSSPLFPLMDVFLGRRRYDSTLGQESLHLRDWFPPHWRAFYAAIGEIDVRDYVAGSGDRSLQGLFDAVNEGYAGEKGFLGVHRLKAYGFLRIAFKAGRTVTIGAFGDRFKEQAWDRINAELDATRMERYDGLVRHRPIGLPVAEAWEIDDAESDPAGAVTRLRLDISGSGVHYRPGDRCGIAAENDDALIDRTLRALRASGEEPIRLDKPWLDALQTRRGREPDPTLPLAELLRLGVIRPVSREVARALAALTASDRLRAILDARAEDQWELWDLLDLLHEGGFATPRLWKAAPWEPESLCRIVPPTPFRLYSIASAMERDAPDGARTLDLAVARLRYETADGPTSRAARREGTASNFVRRVATAREGVRRQRVALQIVPASRFHLPADPSRPIVMFAAGAGIAPFRGFLQDRARDEWGGENWLFYGVRTPDDLLYRGELARLVGTGRLRLHVACSAADRVARYDPAAGALAFVPGPRGRLDRLLMEDEQARALWEFLRDEADGGRGANFYVCGRAGFAATVQRALLEIIARFAGGEAAAVALFNRLVAAGRFGQDVFTTYAGPHEETTRTFDLSEVALHNNESRGYWSVISGKVYDLTGFMEQHPGGHRLIIENAGTDATHAYRAVLHHRNTEVDALLGLYEIGRVRRLQFGTAWGVAVEPGGLRYVSLDEAFRTWVRFLFLVVDMENALANDFGTLRQPLTADDTAGELTPMKIQMIADTHRRFVGNQFATIVGEGVRELWAIAVGLCAPREDLRRLGRDLDVLIEGADARLIAGCSDLLDRLNDRLIATDPPDRATLERARAVANLLYIEDSHFLQMAKLALQEGVRVFETHEEQTIADGGPALLASLTRLPALVAEYQTSLTANLRAIPGLALPADPPQETAPAASAPSRPAELLGHGATIDATALRGE